MLTRSLTLTDLILTGIATIIGSGGFNLIGTGVREGGALWPFALALSGILMLCSSFTYADAFSRFHKNTSETDSIRAAFGPVTEMAGSLSIVLYNLASIVVILVVCASMILPNGSWAAQVGFTISALACMSAGALYGIDLYKHLVAIIAWVLIGILGFSAALGLWGSMTAEIPVFRQPNFLTSVLMFFFVLVGFDNIMKFAEEAKDDADIPRAFYLSNMSSVLLTAGVAVAIMYWVPVAKQDEGAFVTLFATFLGGSQSMRWAIVAFLLLTTFVFFLATSRYLYSLGGKGSWLQAPSAAIATVFGSGSALALLNNTQNLVIITDIGFAVIASLVASSVAVANWNEEKLGAAALSGATATGFFGMIAAAFLSV
jgi:amino acid transporter